MWPLTTIPWLSGASGAPGIGHDVGRGVCFHQRERHVGPSRPCSWPPTGPRTTSSDGSWTSRATRFVVGAPSVSSGASTAVGAVYVFNRTGTTWTQQKKIALAKAPRPLTITAMTCPLTEPPWRSTPLRPDNGKGAVYVYSGRDAGWTRQATFTEDYNMNFGFDICVRGRHPGGWSSPGQPVRRVHRGGLRVYPKWRNLDQTAEDRAERTQLAGRVRFQCVPGW